MTTAIAIVVLVGFPIGVFASLALLWRMNLSDRIDFGPFIKSCLFFLVGEDCKARKLIGRKLRAIRR